METARLTIRLTPRASRDEVIGFAAASNGAELLRVRVTAPPVDGRANEALIRLLADVLDVSRGDVRLVAGQSSREKMVAIDGLPPGEVRRRLDAHIAQIEGREPRSR